MAQIPGWVYIIIGIAVSIFSKIVNARMGDNSLALFFYLGLFFILVGIGKTIMTAIKKKVNKAVDGDKKKTHIIGQNKPSHQQRTQHHQHHQHQKTHQQAHHQQTHHHRTQQMNKPQQNQATNQQRPQHAQHSQQTRQPMQQMQGQHHINKAQHNTNVQHQSIVFCPKCGTKHYPTAAFCSRCGNRLR